VWGWGVAQVEYGGIGGGKMYIRHTHIQGFDLSIWRSNYKFITKNWYMLKAPHSFKPAFQEATL
jgi:hypothetical protein